MQSFSQRNERTSQFKPPCPRSSRQRVDPHRAVTGDAKSETLRWRSPRLVDVAEFITDRRRNARTRSSSKSEGTGRSWARNPWSNTSIKMQSGGLGLWNWNKFHPGGSPWYSSPSEGRFSIGGLQRPVSLRSVAPEDPFVVRRGWCRDFARGYPPLSHPPLCFSCFSFYSLNNRGGATCRGKF